MMRIALTGGIACGKSLAAKFMNEHGIETLDADDIVHEIIPDPAERKRIAAEVFANPEARRALEARIHPLVRERFAAWFAEERPASAPLRIAIIPLLYETGWERDFDFVGCIVSSREEQISRMVQTRGYSIAEAEGRLAAQMPPEEKAARADFVISNGASSEELRRQVLLFIQEAQNRSKTLPTCKEE